MFPPSVPLYAACLLLEVEVVLISFRNKYDELTQFLFLLFSVMSMSIARSRSCLNFILKQV